MTAQPETRSEFHTRRAKGIGGSDVGAILGLDRYRTPMQVWEEKCGISTPSEDMNADQLRGVTFESIARKLYSERSGNIVSGHQTRGQHPEYPFMLYTMDGIEIDRGDEVPLEVKCPSLGMWSRIKREGLPDSWVLQMQHYLCCSGFPRGRYVIFCADRMELLDFVIEADAELHAMLIEKEGAFWQLVVDGVPPADVVAELQGEKIVVVGTVTKRYDDEFGAAARTLREAKALIKTAESLESDAKDALLELVDSKPGIYEVPCVGRIHYQEKAGRVTFDKKALANAQPLDRISTMQKISESLSKMPEQWALTQMQEILDECDLDLTKFDKQGKPFVEMRTYFGSDE